MKPGTSQISFTQCVLLGLLALGPVVFWRASAECFEIPQAALLTTGALFLSWRALSAELASIGRSGPAGFARSVLARIRSWATKDPLGVCVLLYLASATASTMASPNPLQSLHGAPDSTAGLVTGISTAVLYFASRAVARGHPAVFVRYARAAGFASALTSAYALLQLAGLDPFVWGRTATYGGEMRIFGTLGHPNVLGAYLVMTAPLTVWLSIRSRHAAERALWALVATASAAVIAATLSRGAWIGLFFAGITWVVLSLFARGGGGERGARERSRPHGSRSAFRLPAAALLALVGIAASVLLFARTPMGAHFTERVRQIASSSAPTTRSRLQIWRAGLRMAQDHPGLGVGLDSFGTAFPRYRTVEYWNIEWGRTPNKAHNEPIQILATQGIVGGIAALLVVLFAGAAVIRRVTRGDGAARSAGIAAGASVAGFAIQDLASFTVVALGSLAAVLAGWVTSSEAGTAPGREGAARPRRSSTPAWAWVLAALPAAALFVLLVARPLRAQVREKEALDLPAGSDARAEALARAWSDAPWDSRYGNFLGSSLLVRQEREPDQGRDLLQRAASALRRAIAAEPEDAYYHSNLGRVLTAQAMLRPPQASPEEALSAFAEGMARDPVNAQVLDQAGNALLRLGRVPEARAMAYRAATLYPSFAQPMALFGYTALLDQRWRDAADTLELAVNREWWGEETARAATWSNLAGAYIALGRDEEARRAAEEALRIDPLNQDAEANRKLALEGLGKGGSSP